MPSQTCPQCSSEDFKYYQEDGYSECLDCGYISALDVDDPDYEEFDENCPICGGTGEDWRWANGLDFFPCDCSKRNKSIQ